MIIDLKRYWIVILILGWSSVGQAQPLFSVVDRNQPIDISSHRLDADQQRRQSVFTGDVVVVQGATTLRSERLTVYTDEQDQIRMIEAEGKVRIVDPSRTATADKAIYRQQDETLRLLGRAEVIQGENRITGDEIVLYIAESRSVVTSGDGGRVRARIQPEKASKAP